MKEILIESLQGIAKQLPYILGGLVIVIVSYVIMITSAIRYKNRENKKPTELDSNYIKESICTRIDFLLLAIFADFLTTFIAPVPFFTVLLSLYYCILSYKKVHFFMPDLMKDEYRLNILGIKKIATAKSISEAAEAITELPKTENKSNN